MSVTTPGLLIHERAAADLHTLAAMALANPELGAEIAHTVEMLYIVLGRNVALTQDAIVATAKAHAATDVDSDDVEPFFATVGVALPAGAIRLMVTRLTPSNAPVSS